MNAKRTLTLGFALTAFLVVGSAASRSAGFSARVDNPWYPLEPGSTYVYQGVKDGEPSREVMTVTRRTKVIDGAPCAVIRDLLYLRGRLEERTTDWYSQDAKGNVWYFGEKTAELGKTGKVISTAGSWTSGVGGARAGIFMFAHPTPGRWARQEYYKGQAEDHFKVLRTQVSVTVPYISTTHAMLTKEWTPLEPGVIDHKYYVRGIGTVLEQTAKGPLERNELVSFRRGS
ncbi:MAG TPA: hypothetical protein VIM23_04395 [Gaiellaceae bacterium]|jgi:hypothetical protein